MQTELYENKEEHKFMHLVVDGPVPRFGIHFIVFGFQATITLKWQIISLKVASLDNFNYLLTVTYPYHDYMRL